MLKPNEVTQGTPPDPFCPDWLLPLTIKKDGHSDGWLL